MFLELRDIFSAKPMDSDGHLCYLCSEIFDESEELQEHLLEEHDIKREEEQDIDITDILSDLEEEKEEVELYDPPPVMADDDMEDEFLHDTKTKRIDKQKKEAPPTSNLLPFCSNPISDPIQVHYNQIIKGKSSSNKNRPKRKNQKKQLAEQWYQCEQCSFKTNAKHVLKTHKLTHTLDCIFCPFKTVIPNALTDHIRGVHYGKPGYGRYFLQRQEQPPQHQQHSQQQNQSEDRRNVLDIMTGKRFFMVRPSGSSDENLQSDDTRFSYLKAPRQSVIINLQDSQLTQDAYTFLLGQSNILNHKTK